MVFRCTQFIIKFQDEIDRTHEATGQLAGRSRYVTV